MDHDPHGSNTVAIPLQYRRYTVVLPSEHRRNHSTIVNTLGSGQKQSFSVRHCGTICCAFLHSGGSWRGTSDPGIAEPKGENIQHPTSNIQCPSFPRSLDVGCSMLVVGCSQAANEAGWATGLKMRTSTAPAGSWPRTSVDTPKHLAHNAAPRA